ncbi:hypothetical protein [Polymorphospora rubra]|uniref:hypothetical protein n=1 Tax=Polymorphospora rubra TaxID=338584 RepID=UPI001BB3D0AF|nr:hypothetical protein [Polymorphospora rubra]
MTAGGFAGGGHGVPGPRAGGAASPVASANGPGSTAPGPVGAAQGCADIPLADRLPALLTDGASVIVGRGVRTGRTGRDGVIHHEMSLREVRTLAGPEVPDGATVWVETPELPPMPDPIARINPGPLWGPDGALFGIVLPQSLTGGTLGATILQAPLVDGQVILGTSGGCWSTRDLAGEPFHGPLTEIPGSNTYARASAAGFTAVPLAELQRLATDS